MMLLCHLTKTPPPTSGLGIQEKIRKSNKEHIEISLLTVQQMGALHNHLQVLSTFNEHVAYVGQCSQSEGDDFPSSSRMDW